MQPWEMKRFYELARFIDPKQVKSIVLTSGPKGVLIGGTEILGGEPASILRTRTNDYSEIQQIAQNIFTTTATQSINRPAAAKETPPPSQTIPTPAPSVTKLSLEIRNGTNITGLAQKTSDQITAQDYNVLAVSNAAKRNHTTTTIYIISDDQTENAKKLAATLGFPVDSGLPKEESPTNADVLIILGSDAK